MQLTHSRIRPIVLTALLVARASAQTCTPHWSSQFSGPGPSREVTTMAVFDEDGSGPKQPFLFIGGGFAAAGDVLVNGVARWDGIRWSAVGSGLPSSNWLTITSMVVFDDDGDGPHAAGLISLSGGPSSPALARWDGTNWSIIRSVDATCLAVYDPDGDGTDPGKLYIGGTFGPGQRSYDLERGLVHTG